jgi:CBS domain-containing protein
MTFSTAPLTGAPGLDRPVSDLMHAGHVSVPASLPLAAAARTMAAHHIHAVLVCDERGAPLGWVTARGMLHNLPREWLGATAGDAISEELITVAPTATIREALEAFLASRASHVLVCSPGDGSVLGVIAESDLLVLLAGDSPESGP